MTNQQILIRNANEKDLKAILKVEMSAFQPDRQGTIDTFQNRLKLYPQGFFILIWKGYTVGLTTAVITKDINSIKDLEYSDHELFYKSGNSYELRSLAVMKEYQMNGFGTLLVKQQIKYAKKLKMKFFYFTAASDVERFYSKLGFRRVTDYEPFHNSKQALWKIELNKFVMK